MQAHGRICENSTKKKIRLSPKNRCAFPEEYSPKAFLKKCKRPLFGEEGVL